MRLQLKIPLLTLGIMAIVGVATGGIMIYFLRAMAVAEFEQMARALAISVHTSLEHDMLEANREHIRDAAIRLVADPMVNEVVIFDATGKVAISGEKEEEGRIRDDPLIREVLSTGRMVSRSEKQYGRKEFCVLMPVVAKPECLGCHPQGGVLGAIEIGLDMATLDETLQKQGLIMGLFGLATFLTIGALLTSMLRREVIRPLSGLARAAQRFSRGDYSARAEADKDDELGTVATAFNQMATQVEKDTSELRAASEKLAQWGQELEAKVEERTRELLALNAVITAVSRSLNLDQLLGEALEGVCTMMGAEAGTVHLGDGREHPLSLAARYGLPLDEKDTEQEARGSLLAQAIRCGEVAAGPVQGPDSGGGGE
jgi:two-component system NtrC family sensor kinase